MLHARCLYILAAVAGGAARQHDLTGPFADDPGDPLPQLGALGFTSWVAVPGLRFVPATYDAYLAAVLTLWNVLDLNLHDLRGGYNAHSVRLLNTTKPVRGTPYGYMKQVQLGLYSKLVWQRPEVKTFCEIGVNGGHGTAAMLLASPTLVAHSFTMVAQPYHEKALDLLTRYFGSRFHSYPGDSATSVPEFVKANRGKVWCDIISVDGDHSFAAAKRDILAMAPLAAPGAILLIDDINETPGPGDALKEAEKMGVVKIDSFRLWPHGSPSNPCWRRWRGMPLCRNWGIATAKYLTQSNRP